MSSSLDLLQSQNAVAVPQPARRWKTRVLLPGAIVLIMLALVLLTSASALLPATPVRVVPVVVKSVQGSGSSTGGTVTVQGPGWLEPDPHPYFVAALAPGIVDEVHVLEGEPVEENQVVATLVDDDAQLGLARAMADLARREAELRSAEADLVAARLVREHLIDRSRAVKVAEAKVAELDADLLRTEADLAVETAKAAEVADEYDRKSKIVDSEAFSEAVVARLRLRLEAQQATVEATRARQDVIRAKRTQAEADLAAAKQHAELLIEENQAVARAEAAAGVGQAAVDTAKAVRDEAQLRLGRMAVRSPVSGTVMQRLTSPGSKLAEGGDLYSMHVVHVYDPAHMQVRVDVPLADAANVSVDQQAEITVEVLPDRIFTGRVTRIVHQADIQKNTVEVKVAIDNPTPELKPDMLARVRLMGTVGETGTTATRNRIFAPEELLQDTGEGSMTALVVESREGERGRVARRTITPGRTRIDGWIEVVKGLQPGDLLITSADAQRVEPGQRVRVLEHQTEGTGE